MVLWKWQAWIKLVARERCVDMCVDRRMEHIEVEDFVCKVPGAFVV